MKSIFKNISYTVIANCISMLVSVIAVFMLPKFMTVTDYGIWHLYLLYFPFLGFLHFGWIDGIYLRYGGMNFDQLPKERFTCQLLAYLLFEIFMALLLFVVGNIFVTQIYAKELVFSLSIVLVLHMVSGFCNFILQITNRIKEYACLVLSERIAYLFFVAGMLYFGYYGYRVMIAVHIVCMFLLAIFGLYLTKALYVRQLESFGQIWHETVQNISAGSKLLMANIAGLAVLGVIRFAVSQGWSVEVFAKISLAISFSNFVMLFINSVGVVFFPVLKRMSDSRAEELYRHLDWLMVLIMPVILLFYYPLKMFMVWWLPKYVESFLYMGVLFPIFLYESRVVLLANTYFKVLRQEYALMKINWLNVLFSVFVTFIGVVWLHNLDFMVYGLLSVFVFKSLLSEFVLARILKNGDLLPSCTVLFLTVVFVIVNVVIQGQDILALLLVACAYVFVLVLCKNRLQESWWGIKEC